MILSRGSLIRQPEQLAILVLLALLVQKELASAAQGSRFQRLSVALNVGIAPLLIAFAVVMIARLMTVLR